MECMHNVSTLLKLANHTTSLCSESRNNSYIHFLFGFFLYQKNKQYQCIFLSAVSKYLVLETNSSLIL